MWPVTQAATGERNRGKTRQLPGTHATWEVQHCIRVQRLTPLIVHETGPTLAQDKLCIATSALANAIASSRISTRVHVQALDRRRKRVYNG